MHGCFWHRHPGCRFAYKPKSNQDFWSTKFKKNVERDNRVKGELECMEWEVIVIWECETANSATLASKLRENLDRAC